MPSPSSLLSKGSPRAEAAPDYLASEAHYLSIAGRILAALRGDERLVLVTGDSTADTRPLAEALGKLAGPRQSVISVPYGPELTGDELSRAGSAVATLPADGGTVMPSDTGEPASPLFLFSEAHRLSDQQIEEICATIQGGARQHAAGVLLVPPDFLIRLEQSPLRVLREALAGRFPFDAIGDDEAIDFLRHQLAVRHGDEEERRIRPMLFRGLVVLGVLAAVGIGASLTLHYIGMPNLQMPAEHPVPSAGNASPADAPPQPARPGGVLPPPPEPTEPQAAPASRASGPLQPQETPKPDLSTTSRDAARERATPQVSPQPVQPPTGQHLSPAEVTALVTRGDTFLSAGDIASARLFYERAADAGEGAAALRLGATFDPNFLGRAGVRGNPGDPAQAASWYRRARDLGDAAAAEHLKNLDR